MIQTEHTPNPDSLKFISNEIVSTIGTEEFQKKEIKNIKNEFVKDLLNFKGVELVLLSEKFITVKKTQETTWDELKPVVISHINHYFENNKKPILNVEAENKNTDENSDETVIRIKEILDSKIRPAVARDGGDIKFKSFEEGVVKVELQGSCSGCPSSLMTLKQGVQNLLCHYIPEVKSVEAV